MLSAYLEMLHGLGAEDPQLRQLKTQLAAAIHQHFWDDARQCYASKLVAGQLEGFHENIQALALYNNIVPESHVDAVVSALTSTTLPPISFSAMSYLVRPFMEISAATRQYVATKITNAFRPMIFSGSTTLWETAYGACDFDDAGSLCHAWSSIPIYFAHAYTLGIRPLTSGFATFLVSPYPGSLYEASGTVATPAGFIQIKWTRSDAGLLWDATGPESLSPILHPYAEVAIADARYNGVRLVIQ